MKATIRSKVSGARMADAVPPLYRSQVQKACDPARVYSLVLCEHAERDVVSSPTLMRALRRLGPPAPDGVIVVGTVFTEEALAVARQHGARVVALRVAKWTDESARQRQLKHKKEQGEDIAPDSMTKP